MKHKNQYENRRSSLAILAAVAAGVLFAVSPSFVVAQTYKYVDTPGVQPGSDTAYTGDGDYSALHIKGNGVADGVVYEGTHLTLTGNSAAANNEPKGRAVTVTDGGTLRLDNSHLGTSGTASGLHGLYAAGSLSNVYLEESDIITNVADGSNGIYVGAGATITVVNTNVTATVSGTGITVGRSRAVQAEGSGAFLDMSGGKVEIFVLNEATHAHGVSLITNATGTVKDLSITTHGDVSYGVSLGSNAKAEVSGLDIVTNGARAFGLSAETGSVLTATDVRVTTSGVDAHGVRVGSRNTNVSVTSVSVGGQDTRVNVTGAGAAALFMANNTTASTEVKTDPYKLDVDGGAYTSTQGAGLLLTRSVDVATGYAATIDNARVEGRQSIHVNGDYLLGATINASNSHLVGDVTGSGLVQATIRLANGSSLTGSVNSDNARDVAFDLDIDGSSWTSTGASVLEHLTLDGATLHLTLTTLSDAITVKNTPEIKTTTGGNTFVVDLGNDLLAQIASGAAGAGDGTAVLDVFDLITGGATFLGDGKGLEYSLPGYNASGSTYTVTPLEQEGEYRIGDIALAAVPEPSTCAALAGVVLLAYAIVRRRDRR
ncbi:MAG: hypothetical protein LBK99_08425 [Opitutaceae bacterium]|nr:hypothetical protein [Opitutaceae bacterium]